MASISAIIDCGTNTFNLLIAKKDGNRITHLREEREPVKLGAGGMEKNEISVDAIDRALSCLENYLKIIQSHHCDSIQCFATSMVRSASNGEALQNLVKEKTGIEMQVIDGDREAELIYEGVKLACGKLEGNFLVMDIGGGSTEFIFGNNTEIIWKKSYRLGVTRLFEKFNPSDPISKNDREVIHEFILSETEDLQSVLKTSSCKFLIGASGSFDSLCAMLKAKNEELEKVDLCEKVDLKQFEIIRKELWETSLTERLNIPGLISYRAESIPVSFILMDTIWNLHNFSSLLCSPYALKEGVIIE